MAQGTIQNLIRAYGFGLIRPDGELTTGQDLFFHDWDVRVTMFERLEIGQRVAYDLGKDERRGIPRAINIRVLLAG